MSGETIKFLKARVEALEKELENRTNLLKEACELLEKLAKEMEVEFEQVN